ncbi:DUF2817 domain-containing protein [Novosphingobium sp. NDB2Meth1]|uniref:DUF2817 domain-containing protein n=1 Tax=Novosphingobium sp. NDB2Meth1 TaxID=1892847 RepID=UPI00093059EB|nr:DUF2817 domain-containing protein [Novosphingobium sp. NDB2Meth1]
MSEFPFSDTVAQAQTRFLAAAASAGALVEVHPHPLAGPDGEAIGAATAFLGDPQAPRLIAVISGVHGIEGHAGAAIQTAWLDRADRPPLPEGTALLFLHQVNPWGAAWDRRENEDNVDLFRNLVYRGPDFPANSFYAEHEAIINPRHVAGPEREAADRAFADLIAREGFDAVAGSIRRGQHDFPRGMGFNGRGATWSSRLIDGCGARWASSAARIDVLDIHTGFGAPGEALFIPTQPSGSRCYALAEHWFSGQLFLQGSDVMIPQHPRAPFDSWADLPHRPEVCSIGLEYGTDGIDRDVEQMRAYSVHANYGSLASSEAQPLRRWCREKFYPAAPAWRGTVLAAGLAAIDRMVIDPGPR